MGKKLKAKYERTKPNCDIGIIGRVDHEKTTLTSSIKEVIGFIFIFFLLIFVLPHIVDLVFKILFYFLGLILKILLYFIGFIVDLKDFEPPASVGQIKNYNELVKAVNGVQILIFYEDGLDFNLFHELDLDRRISI
jgi:hypothetical protein